MRLFQSLLSLVLFLALTACGAAPAAQQPGTQVAMPTALADDAAVPTSVAAPTAVPTTATAGSISVQHVGGTLALDAPATRVVACSEEAIDFLITLQVQPIGICSGRISGASSGQPYELSHFFPQDALGTPLFVGSSEAPSLELVAQLKPDLIISGVWTSEANDKFAQIAPTFVVDTAAQGYWRETLQQVGKALGREAQAQQFLADYDATAKRLAEQVAPIAANEPDVLFLYSYAASDGTVALGPNWTGSQPFALLGFNVLTPEGIDLASGAAPVSPEIVSQVKADIIFVIRVKAADGTTPRYPIDDLLASVKDTRVIYQEIHATRGSTAPYTDKFVLEEIAGLLGGATTASAEVSFPRTITTARGDVTLQAPAIRVVALEWTYAEDLLALGVQPVGVADIEGYTNWVKVPIALDASVQDVGTRQEPNLEKIAALKPDLILVPDFRIDANKAELDTIAPTLVFSPYPTDGADNQYDEMSETLLKIAAATGRDAKGKEVLEQMDATFAALAANLKQANVAGAPFVLSQAWSGSGGAEMRLFTETAMASQILMRLGLTPAWKDGFQQYGYTTVGIEALPQLSADTHFFYVVQDDDNVFASGAVKPLWESLGFVKAGNAHALGGDTWLFGGPLSAQLLATTVAQALTQPDR